MPRFALALRAAVGQPSRCFVFQATPQYRAARVVESLGKVYKCHYPNRPVASARGVRRSPLHERLVARGAYCRAAEPEHSLFPKRAHSL